MAHYLALFFGGVFLANSLPHLWAGVTGTPLQTPFASPPFRGLSSARVNAGYGLFNLAVAYLLLIRVGAFHVDDLRAVTAAFVGFGLWVWMMAGSFTRLRQQQKD